MQNQCAMARFFVVIGEAITVVSDFGSRFLKGSKLVGTARCAVRPAQVQAGLALSRPTFTKDWIKRILCENGFDVGDQQLLVRLLMLNPEAEDWFDFAKQFL